VILRLVRGRIGANGLPRFADRVRSTYVPEARGTAGLVQFHVGVRPVGDEHDLVILTRWRSVEAATLAFGGDISLPTTLGGIRGAADFYDATHYEIDEAWIRPADGDPAILRLAVGRYVEPGSDVETEHHLRERVPLFGDEMTEGYAARRIVGSAVEVAFISTWSRPPVGHSLEDSFWPDIASRYDDFWVEIYLLIASSPNGSR
jgi:hypothetical protein